MHNWQSELIYVLSTFFICPFWFKADENIVYFTLYTNKLVPIENIRDIHSYLCQQNAKIIDFSLEEQKSSAKRAKKIEKVNYHRFSLNKNISCGKTENMKQQQTLRLFYCKKGLFGEFTAANSVPFLIELDQGILLLESTDNQQKRESELPTKALGTLESLVEMTNSEKK